MNVFNKITLHSLKKNRTRTTVTVIGIILSSAMICAVTTFAASIRQYGIEDRIYTYGNWYGRTLDTDYATYQSVRESEKIEDAACFQQLGYAAAEGSKNETKPYLYLLGMEPDAEKKDSDFMPIHLTSGSLPAAQDEILLPDHLFSSGGIRHEIGDTLTLSIGQRVLDGDVLTQQTPCYTFRDGKRVPNGETLETFMTRSYTVVGFYERLNWKFEQTIYPGFTAITCADETIAEDAVCDVYFRTKRPDDVYLFMSENKLGSDTNRDLLMLYGVFRFESFNVMLYSLSAIVISLIMFGSVALIYNAFSISVSERTKQFGILSSVGATKKQLRRMVLFEALSVSLVGIPIGVLSGIGGIYVTLLFIGDRFHALSSSPVNMTLHVSPVSVLIAAATALVTVLISAWIPSGRASKVSAVEAIRQNADIAVKGKNRKSSRLVRTFFGLPGVLAEKNYRRSRKKYRATVFSLFMSVVLFVSASAFTEYLTETGTGSFNTIGYDLICNLYPSDFEGASLSPDELLGRMRAAKSVTAAAYAREMYQPEVNVRAEDLTEDGFDYLKRNQGKNTDDGMPAIATRISFLDDGSFRALLQEYGLREEEFFDPAHPRALALDGMRRFDVASEKFRTLRFFLRDDFEMTVRTIDRPPDGYRLYDTVRDEDGTMIYRYISTSSDGNEDALLELPEEKAVKDTPLYVGKVLTEMPYFFRDSNTAQLLYPIRFFPTLFDDIGKDDVYGYYFTVKSDRHDESYAAIGNILAENGFGIDTMYDYAEQLESDRSIIVIIRVFSYGFIVLISLIAAANVFNTVSTNIALRRREFAMLRSVGMTQKEFNRMMCFECLRCSAGALLYGLPVSCGITYLIYRAVLSGYETGFRLPWAAIGIVICSVFAVVFASMIYAVRRIKKDNLIDALKNENL